MEILYTALMLGLMGSFHCIGMCGPIALSIPLQGKTFGQKLFGGLLYNIGRTIMYGVMGGIFGLIGQGFHLIGFQQWISIAMGAFMIIAVIIPSITHKLNISIGDSFASKIRTAIQKLFTVKSYGGLFLLGVANALLPCGLVYMAIAGSIGTGSAVLGITFMVLFGLGTIPIMLGISLAGNMISLSVRKKINKIIPYIVVIVGALFILRGLALGIPFISPPINKMNPEIHMKKGACETSSEAIQKSCCHGKGK